MKKTLSYGLAFLITVALCIAMLFLATYAPQSWIDQNLIESVPGLLAEGKTPQYFDRTWSGQLDNWSEALILMSCKAMVEDSQSTMFTNPLYGSWTEDPVIALSEYVWMVKPTPTFYYTRYWMGFRAVLRWALAFLDYFQIRRYLTIGMFVLLYCVLQKITKHLGKAQAAVFALAVLLVRPHVIFSSLQFSSCFLIAFAAMMAVPWVHKHGKFQSLFFMELGMLTMYFDFYTVPLITFGLPMVFLVLLQRKENGCISLRTVLKNILIWAAGYIGMWLAKLLLTDLLTDQSGLVTAFARVFEWFGVGSYGTAYGEIRSPILALKNIWLVILPDREARMLFWMLAAALAALLIWKAKHKELNLDAAKRSACLLFLGILPIIWFCITSAPIVIHGFFQYRTIVLLYWAVGSYLCLILEKGKKSSIPEKNQPENEK